MRYAVFSDVHANLEALEAVSAVFRDSGIDAYVFLGDIVGYGADPRPCLAILRQMAAVAIAGNHDWAAVELFSPDYFNEAAKEAVLWTREQLTATDRGFLGALELVYHAKDFCCVHGTLSRPEEFDYMMDGYRALATFGLFQERICFVGHSHVPGIFVEEGERLSYRQAATVTLEPGRRYIVNDGSVGQPRDGDPRACFCIYDEAAGHIEFRRVAYDVKKAQEKIVGAGLPLSLAERLSRGR